MARILRILTVAIHHLDDPQSTCGSSPYPPSLCPHDSCGDYLKEANGGYNGGYNEAIMEATMEAVDLMEAIMEAIMEGVMEANGGEWRRMEDKCNA
jgi:hypothetical protein